MKKSLILFFVLLCAVLSVMSVSAAPLGTNPGTSELPLLPPTPVTNAQCGRNDSNCKAKCEAWWANMSCEGYPEERRCKFRYVRVLLRLRVRNRNPEVRKILTEYLLLNRKSLKQLARVPAGAKTPTNYIVVNKLKFIVYRE